MRRSVLRRRAKRAYCNKSEGFFRTIRELLLADVLADLLQLARAADHAHPHPAGTQQRDERNVVRPHCAKQSAERDLCLESEGDHCFSRPARLHFAVLVCEPEGRGATWNFAAVRATGVLRPIEDREALRELLARLTARFEAGVENSTYRFDALAEGYVNGMMNGIVGFQMAIDQLEGKFKLGQERSEAERSEVLAGLAKGAPSGV